MDEKNTIQTKAEVHSAFIGDVCTIVEEGRQKAYDAVNSAIIETYWKWVSVS